MNSLPILERNHKGESVRFLQQLLLGYGFDTVLFHAEFDETTEEAVKIFQSQHNLVADGIVNTSTWSLLIDGTFHVCNAPRE
jgi:peptidoglycan hydrolase-like protein with peptidoglycan-binding domain